MTYKNLIPIIFVVLILLSCHKAPKPEIMTTYYYHFDILHGRVKQLTETYKTGSYSQPDTSTTDFDVNGNSMQTKTKGDCECLVKYEYRYNKNGKKVGLIAKSDVRLFPNVYKFDTAGRVVELSAYTKMLEKNSDEQMQQKFFFKYNVIGDRVEEYYYLEPEDQYRKKYKYDNRHLLIEEDYYSYTSHTNAPETINKKTVPYVKTIYHYTSFDSKGNWLKRIAEKKSYNFPVATSKDAITGKSTSNSLGPNGRDTITRKITYY